MKNKAQFHSLTALRGFFILLIVVHNTLNIIPLFDHIPGVSFIVLFGGALGDSMFFLLSGFLLSYGYRDRIREHTIAFSDYLMRRLRKLYPMYFVSNMAALVIAVFQYGISAINLKKLAFTLLMQIGGGLENGNPYNSPTWFISTLFLCYVLFYFVAYHCRKDTPYCSVIALGIGLGYVLMEMDLQIPFCYRETGTGLMNFSIGCALAEVYPRLSRKVHRWLQPVSFLTVAGSFFLMMRYGIEIISGDVPGAFAFMICPVILYLAQVEGPCAKILRWKPFVALGRISSSVFFWHLVVFFAFTGLYFRLVPGGSFGEVPYLLYMVLMLVCSWGSYLVFERKNTTKQAAKG